MKKRNITSFEPEQDVAQMLIRITDKGLTVREVCNRALRKYGMRVAKEIAGEKTKRLSFDLPGVVPLGLELLAA